MQFKVSFKCLKCDSDLNIVKNILLYINEKRSERSMNRDLWILYYVFGQVDKEKIIVGHGLKC